MLDEDFSCRYCFSHEIIKDGVQGGVQYWHCKACGKRFADNQALPGMKTPISQVSSTLSMYYSGMSIDEIRLHLDQEFNNKPSDSTIYEWIKRFSTEASDIADKYVPNVGDVWVADETVLDLDGKKVWFWDIIDSKTRFLLASHLSYNRTAQHAQSLIEKAVKRSGKTPRIILTDKLAAYLEGIEAVLGGDTEHIQSKGFTVQPNTNLIERFHGSLKSRTKVMRGLKTVESALMILDGWLVYYNYFRPHESLDGRTPAIAADINTPMRNWRDVVVYSNHQAIPDEYVELKYPSQYKRLVQQNTEVGIPTRYGLTAKKKGVMKKRKTKPKQTRIIQPQLSSVTFVKSSKSR